MRTLKTAFGSALVAGLFLLSGCGGGGGSSSPTATAPAPATNPPTGGGSGDTAPPVATPAPVSVILAATRYSGQVTILAQNAVPAPSAASAPLPVTSAGKVTATPVNQVFALNRTEDTLSYYGFSDGGGTYVIPVDDLERICANGPQTGLSINGNTSRACGAPDLATNTVLLPGTCSKDIAFYTAFRKSMPGVPLHLDWTSERKFTIDPTGLPGVLLGNGAQINWNGYQGATVKATKTGPGQANVTIDFGSNCVGSFGQMNDAAGTSGRLVDMSVVDGSTWLQFLFHSDKSGADGGSGWGFQSWLDTVSGYTVQPSVAVGYLDFNQGTGNYFVTIPVKCGSKGNITAYRGTRQPDGSTPYDAGISGTDDPLRRPFGLGWLPIQANANEPQLYTLVQDPSVSASLDRTTFNLVIADCN